MSAKVALVTASSAGLGAACVRALATHYRVVVNYHSRAEKAEEVIRAASSVTATYPSSETPRFHAIKADATTRDGITQLVDQTVSTMGRLDLVVSNAGWTRLTDFGALDQQLHEPDWDRCFAVNVKSHLWLFEAAKPHLSRDAAAGGKSGAFVTVASVAGVRPGGSSLAYSVTKAAEIHLTKGLAVIAGPAVRCNSVSPGLMMTEWGAQFPEAKVNAVRAKSALKDTADPDDVAQQIKTIALSNSITGQNVVVDCGFAI